MSPEGWQRRRVREFSERLKRVNVDGIDLEPLSITKDRGVILQSEKYNKRIATDPRKYVFAQDGDFAFDPMSLYYGAIGRVDGIGRGLVSPDYVVFRTDESVDPHYLHALFRYPEMHKIYESLSETGNTFGKRRRLYWSIFEEIDLMLPPRGEQTKIAAILASVNESIEATRAVIDQLQIVKKAMMAELLVRGLPTRHTRFKQTDIGEVPEAWDVVELGAVLEGIDAGWSPQCESRPAAADEWGVLKVSAVTSGVYRDSEQKALPSTLTPRPECEVQSGDVLLARANGVLGLVGRTVRVGATRPRLMLSDKLLRLRPSRTSLEPGYLALTMATETVRSRLLSTTGGSDMRNVSQANLKALRFPLPSIAEQAQLFGAIQCVEDRAERERAGMVALRKLKSSLMSVLLTGEVRVKPDPEPE